MSSESMTTEARIAFYKATKFWILFLIALLVAAVLWRMWDDDGSSPASAPPASAQVSVSLPDASEREPEPEAGYAPVWCVPTARAQEPTPPRRVGSAS